MRRTTRQASTALRYAGSNPIDQPTRSRMGFESAKGSIGSTGVRQDAIDISSWDARRKLAALQQEMSWRRTGRISLPYTSSSTMPCHVSRATQSAITHRYQQLLSTQLTAQCLSYATLSELTQKRGFRFATSVDPELLRKAEEQDQAVSDQHSPIWHDAQASLNRPQPEHPTYVPTGLPSSPISSFSSSSSSSPSNPSFTQSSPPSMPPNRSESSEIDHLYRSLRPMAPPPHHYTHPPKFAPKPFPSGGGLSGLPSSPDSPRPMTTKESHETQTSTTPFPLPHHSHKYWSRQGDVTPPVQFESTPEESAIASYRMHLLIYLARSKGANSEVALKRSMTEESAVDAALKDVFEAMKKEGNSPLDAPRDEVLRRAMAVLDEQIARANNEAEVAKVLEAAADEAVLSLYTPEQLALDYAEYVHETGEHVDPKLYAEQLSLESRAITAAVERYKELSAELTKLGKAAQLKPAQYFVVSWFEPLTEAIEKELEAIAMKKKGKDRRVYGDYLAMLGAPELACIVMHELLSRILVTPSGVRFSEIALHVGKAVNAEVNFIRIRKNRQMFNTVAKNVPGGRLTAPLVMSNASRMLEDAVWTDVVRAKVGAALLSLMISACSASGPRHARDPKRKKQPSVEEQIGMRLKEKAKEMEMERSRESGDTERGLSSLHGTHQNALGDATGLQSEYHLAGESKEPPKGEPGSEDGISKESASSTEDGDFDRILAKHGIEDWLKVGKDNTVVENNQSQGMGDQGYTDSTSTSVQSPLKEKKGSESDAAGQTGFQPVSDPAFTHEFVTTKDGSKVGVIRCNPAVLAVIEEGHAFVASLSPRLLPMVVPPRPWKSARLGGYLSVPSSILRTKGSHKQAEAVAQADMPLVYESLNLMGKVRWRLNERMFKVVKKLWDLGGGVADMPCRKDIPLLEEPPVSNHDLETEEGRASRAAEIQAWKKWTKTMAQIQQANADMHSLRCDLELKLAQAEALMGKIIYFPFNLDFRGRSYPIPPHLNHLGSDLARGLLLFGDAKPLGERGLYWLYAHLAAQFGVDKVSFDDRVAWSKARIDLIRASANDPLERNVPNPLPDKKDTLSPPTPYHDQVPWWQTADAPFQALATCFEIVDALDSGDPANYMCSLPVHQDGSCNGLQHYAALGRDELGGSRVNLLPADKPQDVYTHVLKEVLKLMEEDAAMGHPMAKELLKRVNRKVVKQTVMTSVYGVTFVGAREQIAKQLKDLKNVEWPEPEESSIYQASVYIAKLTLSSLSTVFVGAKSIMTWLGECAQIMASQHQPVSWVTPLGLPVTQPYRKASAHRVTTLMQSVTFADHNDLLPVSSRRQRAAFPPNFVHSLDATHMMLTSLDCAQRGLTFTSVHDSFWTHASDVDVMNECLRDQFIALYTMPVLEDLYQSFVVRFPNIKFPPIPPRGTLDLNKVKDSRYFFS